MKIISFYLPQFHQIPENDEWWGEGFTEWTNMRNSKPLFEVHNQPKVPLNDNYYDLTNPETRKWQAEIAKKYNIFGFCYYHYWFRGKRLLEKPFDEVLKSKEPDFPFCLAWANEPWTRSWDGKNKEVLMPQNYGGRKDWEEHFNYLIQAFLDQRYIKIDNKPVFLIYRPSSIKDCNEMLEFWNMLARDNGLEGIYFIEMLTAFDNTPVSQHFKAKVEFEPMYTLGHHMDRYFNLFKKFRNLVRKTSYLFNFEHERLLNVVDYDRVWDKILKRTRTVSDGASQTFYGAFVDWDNSPRKGREGLIMKGSSPEKFKTYLTEQIKTAKENNVEFIFINAWNEWAEGTYLEPDKKDGYKYLEAVKKALESTK
ncbi:glycoside hydrolase family 99-like domain-containing protein [Neobacillus citreus]|uniref:Glycoside hydrolase family 99-like domain-containing protein n=1 Tax=Neobacillus citreus TaxID=2833578 RepID=A0A942T8H4_9BACI|nr:glycoside hydrolase family 99-like domain-containing protein [Neobacillus citreus]MCH6267008.1 glycoside hydrolase family 99-like domain-containing protein [Neobacillus citreus]